MSLLEALFHKMKISAKTSAINDYDVEKQRSCLKRAKEHRIAAQEQRKNMKNIDVNALIADFDATDRLARESRERNHFAETILFALSGESK